MVVQGAGPYVGVLLQHRRWHVQVHVEVAGHTANNSFKPTPLRGAA